MSFNCSYFDKKKFLIGTYSEPSRTSRMELFAKLVNGFKQLIVFWKACCLGMFWRGSEYDSDLTTDFFIIPWHIPLKSVYNYFWIKACVVQKPVNGFAKQVDWLISIWFRWFCWGCFRTDYSTVLFSEAAIAQCPLVFIHVAIHSWQFCRLLACSFT